MTRASPTPRRKRRGNTRGALMMIAVLLLGSALLRIGGNAGQALALASPESETQQSGSAPGGQACETADDFKAMLAAFQQREAQLQTREEALRNRMHALSIADEEVGRKLAELTRAETALRETIALADTAAESDLDRLTRVYETMKPKQAAALFEEMSPDFAAGFLGRMRPEAAAAIMAGLSPGAAHSFSVVLAGRNADVPTE